MGEWIDLSPMEARFGTRANIKNFFPAGAVMYVYINEQLRSKGTDHGDVLYCSTGVADQAAARRGLRILPTQMHSLQPDNRRHFDVDPRFVYGQCVGGQFEAMLRIHRRARKWPECDARALTDRTYRDGLLKHMMHQRD